MQPTDSPGRPQPLGPVEEGRRIDAIDAARGLALLGIFCVNIQFFAAPFGAMFEPKPPAGLADGAAFFFEKIFCESKFYPLFSTLFGAGLVLQMQRIEDRATAGGRGGRGGAFGGLYMRRLGVLAVLGLLHALLLWYGDILFIYAIAGVALLLLRRLSVRGLVIAGIVTMSVAFVVSEGFTALMVVGERSRAGEVAGPPSPEAPAPEEPGTPPDAQRESTPSRAPDGQEASDDAAKGAHQQGAPEPHAQGADEPQAQETPPARERARTPLERVIEGFRDGSITKEMEAKNLPPFSTRVWVEAETEAYRHGPYLQAVAFRAAAWLFILTFTLFGFGWTVLGMFFFGAALTKAGFFTDAGRPWHRRLVVLAAALGLPLAVSVPLMMAASPEYPGALLGVSAAIFVAGPLMALGYLSAILMLTRAGRLAWLTRPLALMGRMALSNYLLETVLATFVFYHWGLGLFGTVGHAGRLGIVVAIYAVLAVFSALWLRRFRFGPMEWLWRTLTYLRPQPFLRHRPPRGP